MELMFVLVKVIEDKVITTFWLLSVDKEQESENCDDEQRVEALYYMKEEFVRVKINEEGFICEENGVIRNMYIYPAGLFIVVRSVYLVVDEEERL